MRLKQRYGIVINRDQYRHLSAAIAQGKYDLAQVVQKEPWKSWVLVDLDGVPCCVLYDFRLNHALTCIEYKNGLTKILDCWLEKPRKGIAKLKAKTIHTKDYS